MAYDEELAGRIRELLSGESDASEMRMFGGLGFLVRGKLAVAARGQGGMMVRVDAAEATRLVDAGEAQVVEMHGRPVKGWVRVAPERLQTEQLLAPWVESGVAYARSLLPNGQSVRDHCPVSARLRRADAAEVEAALARLEAGEASDADLRLLTRHFLAELAHRAPGRSVEVRVAPYAAVQCVAGPRHSRGNPSAVVETDPLTWVRLATGRLGWAEAKGRGRLSASGERSDLSALLPLTGEQTGQ